MQKVYNAALPIFTNGLFRPNMGDVSEEHGESFQQDIQAMEKRYQGRWNAVMMDDYIWSLIRDDDKIHKRKPRSNVHI